MIEMHGLLKNWFTEQEFIYASVLDAFGIKTANGLRLFAYLQFYGSNGGLKIGEKINLNDGSVQYGHTWVKHKTIKDFCRPDIFDEIKNLTSKAVEHLYEVYGKPNLAFVSRTNNIH